MVILISMNIRNLIASHSFFALPKNGSAWVSVFLAIVLVTLPNLVASFVPCYTWWGLQLWIFGISLILLPCVFGLPLRFMLWLALPLALLVPASLACLFSIKSFPSSFLMLAALETNQMELAALQVPVLLAAVGTLVLPCLYAWYVKKRIPEGLRLGTVGRVLVLASLLAPVCSDWTSQGQEVTLARVKQRLFATFPTATFCCAYEAFEIRGRIQSRKDLADGIAVTQEKEFKDETNRQVHMLVIGESATKSCFGLYGYDRQTTPLLEHTDGLMKFGDVSCTATVTLIAVPSLLTAAPPGRLIEASRQASILTAYKKAGFKVYWISAQKKHGTYDTLTSIFSADADEDTFMSGKFDYMARGSYPTAHDSGMLPLVREIIQRNEPKVLFVHHTIGSHGPYPVRYPPELARFPADTKSVMDALFRISLGTSSDPQDMELAQNSYDNTIFATDYLLANLIHELKKARASSWLYYVSDHGENTSTARFGKFMHGTITRQVVEVPMLMWVSPLYEQAHAGRVASLKSHLNTPFSASSTFHTLLDMGGLSCVDFKEEWSAASPGFVPGPRHVCNPSGLVFDYDEYFSSQPSPEAAQAQPQQPAEKAASVAAGE
jgi:glucan phosphoethanolaminetransferase (alkaline phosphatase superfamily)